MNNTGRTKVDNELAIKETHSVSGYCVVLPADCEKMFGSVRFHGRRLTQAFRPRRLFFTPHNRKVTAPIQLLCTPVLQIDPANIQKPVRAHEPCSCGIRLALA